MLAAKVWRRVFGVDDRTVIERVEFDDETDVVVAHVRVRRPCKQRCGRCGRKAPGYDQGQGRRRWRSPDLGEIRSFVESDAPRVSCGVHGPTVIQVPWARHGAGHTRAFDDTVAWLAMRCSKTAVTELMRVAWRTVGSILTRVSADIDSSVDRLDGLSRIGIDEIAYKRGHRYLTVVVDHDRRCLVWAAPGRDAATLRGFFELLGPERAAVITQVSADAAPWIRQAVTEACPNAVLCADPFHVVAWGLDALDEVRRHVWNQARGGRPQPASDGRRTSRPRAGNPIKKTRWALWKNPENLSDRQRHQLEWIAGNHPDLWRAYRLKEGLRFVFRVKGTEAKTALDRWLAWASRSRLPAFIELARRIRRHRPTIDATLETGLSNGLVESTNTKIRVITRVAFGFHGPQPLIALAMLTLGTPRPALPGRP